MWPNCAFFNSPVKCGSWDLQSLRQRTNIGSLAKRYFCNVGKVDMNTFAATCSCTFGRYIGHQSLGNTIFTSSPNPTNSFCVNREQCCNLLYYTPFYISHPHFPLTEFHKRQGIDDWRFLFVLQKIEWFWEKESISFWDELEKEW